MEKMEKDTILTGDKAVTIVVSRHVFPGKEKEYDELIRRMIEEATKIPGNLGVTMLVPEPGKAGLHHVVWRFADEKSMHVWETSYARQKLSHEADAISRRSRQEATGLETWFSIPDVPELETPPHWKMAIVTFFAVYVLSILLIPLIKWAFGHLNFYVESIIVTAGLIGILTFAVMPFLSRHVFRNWLYRK
jgi:antibiotic biosynthesis monooxygenase (ABM) superfamily enzyme